MGNGQTAISSNPKNLMLCSDKKFSNRKHGNACTKLAYWLLLRRSHYKNVHLETLEKYS